MVLIALFMPPVQVTKEAIKMMMDQSYDSRTKRRVIYGWPSIRIQKFGWKSDGTEEGLEVSFESEVMGRSSVG